MFRLEAIFAKHGDCLLLHYGADDPHPRWLLIDGGARGVYASFLKPRLEQIAMSRAVAEAFGYVSTVTLYVSKDIYAALHDTKIQWSTMLMWMSYVVMLAVPLSLVGSGWSFRRHLQA